MTLYEFLIKLVQENNNRKIAYITKNSGKLGAVHVALVEGCDVSGSSTRVFGIHPMGIANLPENIDIALFEKDETSEEHLLRHVKFSPKYFIYEVDELNTELIYAEDRIAKESGGRS